MQTGVAYLYLLQNSRAHNSQQHKQTLALESILADCQHGTVPRSKVLRNPVSPVLS